MKIAYILPLGTIVSNKSNGIRMQAAVWAEELKKRGHDVELIDIWGNYDWRSFDIIHIFGIFADVADLIRVLSLKTNAKFVYSPIIDTNRPWYLSRFAAKFEFSPFHMISPWSVLRHTACQHVHFLARSEYERRYISKALGVAPERIDKVMLPFRFGNNAILPDVKRENFCLHISILSGPHKNVRRLIDAAIKYDFRLVLAGKCGSRDFQHFLDETIRKHPNIEYRGWISDEEMLRLYATAKCFALPSIFEGVGLVALDAAACGCDIVITKLGGPHEYYSDMASMVNPMSVDEIGTSIKEFLEGKTFQPELSKYVQENFSPEKNAELLGTIYEMGK